MKDIRVKITKDEEDTLANLQDALQRNGYKAKVTMADVFHFLLTQEHNTQNLSFVKLGTATYIRLMGVLVAEILKSMKVKLTEAEGLELAESIKQHAIEHLIGQHTIYENGKPMISKILEGELEHAEGEILN